MATDLVKANATSVVISEAKAVRSSMAALLTFVATAEADGVLDALDRIRMAREWAKLKKVAQEVCADLLRVEIVCLRRMVAINADGVLSASMRGAARYFASLTEGEALDLIARYPSTSSTSVLYQQVRADIAADRARQSGREFAASPGSSAIPGDVLNRAIRNAGRDFHAAMAAVLDRLAGTGDTTVAEMTAVAYDELGISPRGELATDKAIREGISEVCRLALRQSKTVSVGDLQAPKFVTCLRDGITWTRVPFANATLSQLDQMIGLREEQMRQDRAALDRLKELRAALNIKGASPDMKLGDRATRATARAA